MSRAERRSFKHVSRVSLPSEHKQAARLPARRLADVVIARAFPEILGDPVAVFQRETGDFFQPHEEM